MAYVFPVSIPFDRLTKFCEQHGVARLSLFGSVLRDDFTPTSDIDVLVEFKPGTRIGFFGFQALEDELTAMLGRRVDLNTPQCLSDSFRDQVLREAGPIHVAA